MARDRTIDITAYAETALVARDRIPAPRRPSDASAPSWEALGLPDPASPPVRRRDLRARAAQPEPASAEEPVRPRFHVDRGWGEHPGHVLPAEHDQHHGYEDGYDDGYEGDGYDDGCDDEPVERRPAPVADAPRRLSTLALAFVVVGVLLAGVAGFLLGSASNSGALARAHTATTTARQAQLAAEQQLAVAQQGQTNAESAAVDAQTAKQAALTSAQDAASAAPSAVGRATAAAPTAGSDDDTSQPATADAAGLSGEDDANSAAASGSDSGPASSSGSGSGSTSGSGSVDDAGQAASPAVEGTTTDVG